MSTKKIIIIGQKTSAFLTAAALSRSGHDVTVINSGSQSDTSSFAENLLEVESPRSEAALFEAVAWLENQFQTQIQTLEVDQSPAALSNQQVQTFLGFGEAEYKTISPLSAFNHSSTLRFKPHLSQVVNRLLSEKNFNVIDFSEVTAINDLDQKIQSITINGQQTLEADFFIFTDHPKELFQFLPADTMTSKIKNRIAKSPSWTEIKLMFKHEKPLFMPDHTLFVLPPSIRNEPFVGQFQILEQENSSNCYSVWQGYVDSALAEQPEAISAHLKFIKKSLQKHFESSQDFNKELQISINPNGFSELAWSTEGFGFEDDLKNFFVASPLQASDTGLSACVMAAFRACQFVNSNLTTLSDSEARVAPSILSSSEVAEPTASC